MGVARTSDVFCTRVEAHRDRRFSNQITGTRTDDMHAQHSIRCGVGKNLHSTLRVPQCAGARVECDGAAAIDCDRVLLAVGRAPNTERLGLEVVGISLDAKGRIPVDAHFATSSPTA